MDMFQAHMEMYQAHMASNVNSKSDMWGWGVCTLQMVIGSADADDFEKLIAKEDAEFEKDVIQRRNMAYAGEADREPGLMAIMLKVIKGALEPTPLERLTPEQAASKLHKFVDKKLRDVNIKTPSSLPREDTPPIRLVAIHSLRARECSQYRSLQLCSGRRGSSPRDQVSSPSLPPSPFSLPAYPHTTGPARVGGWTSTLTSPTSRDPHAR